MIKAKGNRKEDGKAVGLSKVTLLLLTISSDVFPDFSRRWKELMKMTDRILVEDAEACAAAAFSEFKRIEPEHGIINATLLASSMLCHYLTDLIRQHNASDDGHDVISIAYQALLTEVRLFAQIRRGDVV